MFRLENPILLHLLWALLLQAALLAVYWAWRQQPLHDLILYLLPIFVDGIGYPAQPDKFNLLEHSRNTLSVLDNLSQIHS